MKQEISNAVIRRLPKYLRYLTGLENRGIERISSQQLGELTGFTASQIRQDFNHFGGFGQQGYGYNVKFLKEEIARIIGLHQPKRIAIVGLGHLGTALANNGILNEESFRLTALFDKNPEVIGTEMAGIRVSDVSEMSKVIRERKIDILTVTTPRSVAQAVVDEAVQAGVRGIWNFALLDLVLPKGVALENVHLRESLFTLDYYMSNGGKEE
ncbi:MAG: redox-sensing transcriptional repressor Rex [Peptoniphilaceae bacterium]|nr:redox-sensing transcriptional repressor Rex [Peptoniphilaceae bacterium]MDD7543215.1 redox-sensing transcriptional repressor Rex [Peptoniphilaceae bacterium]MDY5765582.1 redox-sensing transcriptional repressor Rex [Peptoniphilaceae bacterium]MDY5842117.1 redox-sensing transcriptional repressor Rex [Peptoniphilaceae bacterium]MDY6146996.1 redox-sensing transcriptional repressor Rex [Peptoniphilaceae bacterium]